ncbi:MAG: SUMF1/EgtB/PvdO family nonheme iron enzyme, partial [SAR324 cluster bacterium]|nr:SUMF1/EgtB/PvdO family nonheme iron enzyme [SAR324 cluster bacterium]
MHTHRKGLKIKGFILLFTTLVGWSLTAFGGDGLIQVSADQPKAIVYLNGNKKAMIAEGYTAIKVPEGDYVLRVEKPIDENSYWFAEEKGIFVGEGTSTKFDLKLEKRLTAKGKASEEKRKEAEKLAEEKRKQEEKLAEKKRKEAVLKQISPSMVLIKPGSFQMGDDQDGPVHQVTLTKAFYISDHEVTVGEYRPFDRSAHSTA